MSRPISKRFLKDTIILENIISRNQYNKPVYDTPIEISFVLFESILEQNNANLGEMNDDTGLLIYDMVNSTPQGVVFNQDAKVTYDGVIYNIRAVGNFKPHHLEIRLS